MHDVSGVRITPEMTVSQFGYHTSARSPLYETLHYEIRFVYLLHRTGVFSYRCGNGTDAHRATLELVYYSQ